MKGDGERRREGRGEGEMLCICFGRRDTREVSRQSDVTCWPMCSKMQRQCLKLCASICQGTGSVYNLGDSWPPNITIHCSHPIPEK